MKIQYLVSWYQKKIGTYDKQLWEKTIEQRILHGLTHIPMKTAKPKTDYIDVDLVRGSSFSKAKPKHGFLTTARLATLRLFFLPLYGKWWIDQTSKGVFTFLLVLYILQVLNIIVYFYNTSNLADTSEHLTSSEISIPVIMMLILSCIHSQIVSTNSYPDKQHPCSKITATKTKRKRIFTKTRILSTDECLQDDNKKLHKSNSSNRIDSYVWKSKVNREVDECIYKSSIDIKKPVELLGVNKMQVLPENEKVHDDGFESLNGTGSSENGDDKMINKNSLNRHIKTENEQYNGDIQKRKKSTTYKCSSDEQESDTESDTNLNMLTSESLPSQLGAKIIRLKQEESSDSEEERHILIPSDKENFCPLTEGTTSATEWIGVTTNSEECSYSSQYNESDSEFEINNKDHLPWAPTFILNPSCAPSDRVSCTVWKNRDIKKAYLSVLDISSSIIARVESMPETLDYFYSGIVFSVILSLLPALCRLIDYTVQVSSEEENSLTVIEMTFLSLNKLSSSLTTLIDAAFGSILWERIVTTIATVERFWLSFLFFFLLSVAERTFKQRFLYAKLFSHLTSTRRARKSELPHFRLNKVRNIKTWLSVRSYLKRRGPQRSVDVIVSIAFIITLLLLSFISMELLNDSVSLHSQYNLEALCWSLTLGIYLLRFMTLGTKINRKYRNLSVLITEQINLYLQIEQKPHKKEELTVANSVLKLAADLLKELDCPFKIIGLSANPYLYTITKVVILSALSAVLSEILGFKLKLHKIKIK